METVELGTLDQTGGSQQVASAETTPPVNSSQAASGNENTINGSGNWQFIDGQWQSSDANPSGGPLGGGMPTGGGMPIGGDNGASGGGMPTGGDNAASGEGSPFAGGPTGDSNSPFNNGNNPFFAGNSPLYGGGDLPIEGNNVSDADSLPLPFGNSNWPYGEESTLR